MLEELLNTCDIPEQRKNINVKANIQWLLRNISIRNGTNANLTLILSLLTKKLKEEM